MLLNSELKSSQGFIDIYPHCSGIMMEESSRRPHVIGKRIAEPKSLQRQASNKRANYFSVESLVLLIWLTASLLFLPLILPPLPPPPFLLLLIPLGILGVLLILAFMPSDVREMASSYL